MTPLTPGRKYGAPLLNWVIGAAFTLFVALVIYVYRWMDSVKDNHLTHIQEAVQQTANHTAETNLKLIELSIREEARHTQQIEAFDHLKELIRSRGL